MKKRALSPLLFYKLTGITGTSSGTINFAFANESSSMASKISKMRFGKINIGTVLKTVYVKKIREILQNKPELKDQIILLKDASCAVTEMVKHKIKLLNSNQRI
ncbi:class II fructose-bisphosphate aldolase [Pseudothermotoga elfii]|uniref:class II fructose-bisphosphate aldolase n=1 Tax=Pseudothermotoga elfii TaxID=38322 RepID=UPI00048C3635|nr:class II fructose-bisphosphate aldolase [Pseudothermotoga elfii]